MKKTKKRFRGILAGILAVLLTASPVWAVVDLNAVYEISTNRIEGWPQMADINCNTAVVMEADTGTIVYNKGAYELRYPASITKLMTLLVTVENCADISETVTFTETGVRDVTPDSGNIGMQLGETMTMEDCLYAMILYSANEVSAQIAEHVGGTEEAFIEMMNQKALELGCTNTHFTNASGLPDTEQYTTARDMALIFREGLKNKLFRKVIKKRTYTIPATNLNPEPRKLTTHHPLNAKGASYYYEGCIGGKSGMTNDAGHTLVTGAKRDGVTYIVVTLRGADLAQCSADSIALFDYAYQNFRKVEVEGGSVVIPNTLTVDQLTVNTETTDAGTVNSYYAGDYLVGQGTIPKEVPPTATPTPDPDEEYYAQLDAMWAAEEAAEASGTETAEEKEEGLSRMAVILLSVMGVMGVLLLGLIGILIRQDHIRKKKRMQRHLERQARAQANPKITSMEEIKKAKKTEIELPPVFQNPPNNNGKPPRPRKSPRPGR